MNEQKIIKLQEKLGYTFTDPGLLQNALIHSSYANEKSKTGLVSNERLEFLGDSLLGTAVALLIYENRPDLAEGKMTKLRAELVCEKSLASIAKHFDIGSYLLLGRGEETGGGRNRPSILSDAFEAILAAIYLDGGFKPITRLIRDIFISRLEGRDNLSSDYKTLLQEKIHSKPGSTLIYDLIKESGPDHNKEFTVEVKLNGKTIGKGTGRSKKNAEQKAAEAALTNI